MTSPSNAAIVPTPAPLDRIDVTAVDQVLTLQNGMTAGYGVNDGNNDNPKPLGQQYGTWPYQPTRVGFIRNVSPVQTTPSNPTGLFTLYFMYNPNQIQVTWMTNLSSTAPLYLYGTDASNALTQVNSATGGLSDSAAVPNLANTQSVAWTLYFDRTYDMMYGNGDIGTSGHYGNQAAEDDRGVLKDVAALYNLMGTFLSTAAVPISTPCEVVFGQNGGGQLFGFTGYLSNLTITYGIFRHDMIPSQCEVDLTLTTTYVANSVSPTGAGTTGISSLPSSGLLSTLPSSSNPASSSTGPPATITLPSVPGLGTQTVPNPAAG